MRPSKRRAFPPWAGQALAAGERYEQLRFASLQLLDQQAKGATFDMVDFDGVRLPAAHLEQCELIDVRIADSDLSNLRLDRSLLRRVQVRGSRLVGLAGPEALIEDCLFEECDLGLAQLRFCTVRRARFVRCNLHEADFASSELASVVFRDCRLEGADMSQVKALEMDLRGSQLEGIKLSPEQMKGGLVDFEQALYLIRLLGLTVGPLGPDED